MWYKGLVDPQQPFVSADREAGDVIIGDEQLISYPSGASSMTKSTEGIVMRGAEIRGITTHAIGFADNYCFTNYGGRHEVLRRKLGREPSLLEIKQSFRRAD